MPQLCTSPTPLPRVPLTSNPTAVPPPLPRRPSSKSIKINNNSSNNNQNLSISSSSPKLRTSLPIPLCRSPFHSPVRANSLPHAPKVPPRERKPKENNNIQVFQKPKVVFLNNHAHARNLPNSSKKQQQQQPDKSNNLSPKSSIEKQQNQHNKTTTTNLSDEMIQMISEREREMFDYHATSRKQPQLLPKHKNNNNTPKAPPITTMEQIYCQKCHLLLPHNNSKSRTSTNSNITTSSSLSCCFWLVSIKNYISRKWNGRRKRTTINQAKKYDKCKEFDSASVEDENTTQFCSCDKQLK